MALNPSGAISLAGPTAGQSIAVELGVSATATISLNDTNVRTLAGVASGVIVMPTNFYGKSNSTLTQKAIFGFGNAAIGPSNVTSITNLISSTGVVSSDTPGVGTARFGPGGVGYGGDKGIFVLGGLHGPTFTSPIYNYVSNTGVVSSDNSVSGTARSNSMGIIYGSDKGLVFGGAPGGNPASSTNGNYISNTGVVAASAVVSGSSARGQGFGASYGGNNDKGILGLGNAGPTGAYVQNYQLVSNTGVMAATTPLSGVTPRTYISAAGYGGDKAIAAFGRPSAGGNVSISNLISNTGVLASDTPGVGTARTGPAAAIYGNDKAIFGYGVVGINVGPVLSVSNLVSNTGVVSSDTPGVGTARWSITGVGYSLTA
jgi:hypothetical protein